MSDEISFNLFGEGGFINPTRWSHSPTLEERFEIPFYDPWAGGFMKKQSRDFDGGWRWFDTYEGDTMCIYNTKLDRRAHWHLTRTDLVDTRLTPECLLLWVKGMVLVEHQYYTAKNWLEDHIRAMARKAMIEIKKEIHGDDNSAHLHSVRN
jgi:hypothetical protein